MMIYLLFGLILMFGIFLSPGRFQYFVMLFIQLIILCLSSIVAFQSFNDPNPIIINLFELQGREINLMVDKLSGFFIFIINFTVLTGALYARGYLLPFHRKKTKTEMAWHYFNFLVLYISMLMVVMIREGFSFLIFWELMSVSTFFLIVFESDKSENVKAGIKFLLQMHVALFILIISFFISSFATDQNFGFDNLTIYFKEYSPFPLFLLFFIGFGVKAGFIPLHTWLPHAHPSAPSHVSGIMSGVMIKMGIYGIVRVLTYIHTELIQIGIFILIISVISGIVGVTIAIVQHDFKRLLAYHSIENIGIIGIGIGIGVIGLGINNPVLASLGFAGGLLHVLNHSLFKSLLFYSAGSIYQMTHIRNIELLGGLMKKMPLTALFFLLGAMAISGLPPFNGFISEFLIYIGLFINLSSEDLGLSFLLLGSVVALVVIGGLAIYCFTKVFSIIFLGNPRSESEILAKEVPKSMLVPKFLISFLIIIIGVCPVLILKPLSLVTGIFVEDISILQNMSGSFSSFSLVFGLLLLFIFLIWVLKLKLSRKKNHSIETTWGCGYTGGIPSVHQYTATSYAGYVSFKAKLLVGIKKKFKKIEKENIFPDETKYETHNSDIFEDNLVINPVKKLFLFMEKIAVLQTGNIQHYLLYAILFVVVISLLTIFKII